MKIYKNEKFGKEEKGTRIMKPEMACRDLYYCCRILSAYHVVQHIKSYTLEVSSILLPFCRRNVRISSICAMKRINSRRPNRAPRNFLWKILVNFFYFVFFFLNEKTLDHDMKNHQPQTLQRKLIRFSHKGGLYASILSASGYFMSPIYRGLTVQFKMLGFFLFLFQTSFYPLWYKWMR